MKQFKWSIGFFLMLVAFTACNSEDMIPVIGTDADGNLAQVMVPQSEYSKRLQAAVETVNDSTMPALTRSENKKAWMLRTLLIGVGATADIGIGPWKVGVTPRFRLVFSNSTDPTLP